MNLSPRRGLTLVASLLIVCLVIATPKVALANVNAIVEKMLVNIYPSEKTSFHAGLKICDVSNEDCTSGKINLYDRRVRIYLGNIKTATQRDHSTLVNVYFPERQQKTILYDGKSLYLLLPTTKVPIRIPPQQTLLGDADVGAILDIDYSVYQARELDRNSEIVKVEFTLPAKKQQFPKIILGISLSTFTPVSGDFYSDTGTLIRHAEYRNVGPLGARRTFRRVLVDSLLTKNTSVTVIDYLTEDNVQVPDEFFRKSEMESFRSTY